MSTSAPSVIEGVGKYRTLDERREAISGDRGCAAIVVGTRDSKAG